MVVASQTSKAATRCARTQGRTDCELPVQIGDRAAQHRRKNEVLGHVRITSKGSGATLRLLCHTMLIGLTLLTSFFSFFFLRNKRIRMKEKKNKYTNLHGIEKQLPPSYKKKEDVEGFCLFVSCFFFFFGRQFIVV